MYYIIAGERAQDDNSPVNASPSPPTKDQKLRGAILEWYAGGRESCPGKIRTNAKKIGCVIFSSHFYGVPLVRIPFYITVFEEKAYKHLAVMRDGLIIRCSERRNEEFAGRVRIDPHSPTHILSLCTDIYGLSKMVNFADEFRLPLPRSIREFLIARQP